MLPVVNVAPNNPFDHIETLAIAIAGSEITRSDERRHLGIFYRTDDGALSLIHMGWHLDLNKISPDIRYCWIPCKGIDPVVLETIADWLDIIWEANGQYLPYSIRQYDANPFDMSGKLIKRNAGDGFTCATFVLWVFHRAQLDLIDKSSWPHRLEDLKSKQWVINMLRKHNPEAEEHIIAQIEDIDSAIRFRPEEVAGVAAIYIDTPIQFDQAVDLGECVLNGMEHLNKI